MTRVSLHFSQAGVEDRTRDLMAPKGPWIQFVESKDALSQVIRKYTGEYHSTYKLLGIVPPPLAQPHHDALSRTETISLLIGDCGLEGEINNGIGWAVSTLIKGNFPVKGTPMERIQKTADSLDKLSQLSSHGHGSNISRKLNIAPIETSRQGLERCAAEIHEWTAFNKDADIITSEDHKVIIQALDHYQTALGQILEWANYVQGYFRQIQPSRSPDVGPAR